MSIDEYNKIAVSPEQQAEQKRRSDFLKQSTQDANVLYEALGKSGRAMKIKPEQEYWIVEAKPEPKAEAEEPEPGKNEEE